MSITRQRHWAVVSNIDLMDSILNANNLGGFKQGSGGKLSACLDFTLSLMIVVRR